MEKSSADENGERPGMAGWARNLVRAKSRGLAHEVLIGVIVVVVAIAIPLRGSAYTIQLATDVLTFATLAYGWNLISGFTGYLSFGQSSFFGLGAYTTGMLVLHGHVPWYFAIGPAGLVAAAAAVLLGPIMLRLRGILFALGMFGLARILSVVFSDWDFAGGSLGITLPAQLTPTAVYIGMALLTLAAFALNAFFARSGFGLDAMSVREDEDAAAALGVPTTRVKVIAFILSAALAGLAGGLVAWSRSYFDPSGAFDPAIDLRTVVFVLFGGIGTLWGPLLGTAVLMVVGEQFLVYFPNLELALYGGVVIATVLALPGGLVSLANRFGWLRRRAALAPPSLPVDAPPPRAPLIEGGTPVLEVVDLTVRFGGLLALDRVSFKIGRGETVSIIGANGAGKTTLFNAITGFVTPTSGDIRLNGASVVKLPVFRRVQKGIARTFQIPRLMPSMTVWENVVLASRHGRQSHRPVAHAAWVLRTVGLDAMWLDPVEHLTPGLQRELELARVLALQPDLVLLDEVMAGMTREEQDSVRAIIRRLEEFGVAGVACVEHVIAAIADISDRMIVLDFGRKIADDIPAKVLEDPVVVRAYLGEPL